MVYYRVRIEYDGAAVAPINGKRVPMNLIANELFTENEKKKYNLSNRALEKVNISRKKVRWKFGARFCMNDGE